MPVESNKILGGRRDENHPVRGFAQREGTHQGSHCGSTVDPQGINTGGMSTRGRSLPWGLRGVDFRPLLRPWDYEIRDQRPQNIIFPNEEGLG